MNAHKPQLDQMTPAEIRVICEYLLYTMDIEQRTKLKNTYPGLYQKLYPGGMADQDAWNRQYPTTLPECGTS
jgi:hypothetical protein